MALIKRWRLNRGDAIQTGLMFLAGLFVLAYSAALSLSQSVMNRGEIRSLRLDHWFGVLAWVVVFSLVHRETIRRLPGRDPFLLPAAALGGLVGGFLLLQTSERLFRELVPYLILTASLLLAVQEPLKRWLTHRRTTNDERRATSENPPGSLSAPRHSPPSEAWAAIPVFFAAIYGGYFGAGLSVIVLAALGLLLDDSLTRLNATKQAIGFAANTAAALLFLFSGQVHWPAALVMAAGAVAGGALGGRLAGRVRPATLRLVVVTVGLGVGLVYLVRG